MDSPRLHVLPILFDFFLADLNHLATLSGGGGGGGRGLFAAEVVFFAILRNRVSNYVCRRERRALDVCRTLGQQVSRRVAGDAAGVAAERRVSGGTVGRDAKTATGTAHAGIFSARAEKPARPLLQPQHLASSYAVVSRRSGIATILTTTKNIKSQTTINHTQSISVALTSESFQHLKWHISNSQNSIYI